MGKETLEEQEIWKDIVGYEGKYRVSSLGKILSLAREIKTRWPNTKRARVCDERILTPGVDGGGYLHVVLHKDSKKSTRKIHNLVTSAFFGPKLTNHQVHHIDGNKRNNSVSNLVYVRSDIHNSFEHKGKFSGEKNCKAKLTESQALEVIELLNQGCSRRLISEKYGIHTDTVCNIATRKTWRHLHDGKH